MPTDVTPAPPLVWITSVWPGATMSRETVKVVERLPMLVPETLDPTG
jgi:hypothetical protein